MGEKKGPGMGVITKAQTFYNKGFKLDRTMEGIAGASRLYDQYEQGKEMMKNQENSRKQEQSKIPTVQDLKNAMNIQYREIRDDNTELGDR